MKLHAVPPGFTLDPTPWIEDYLEGLPDEDDLGFFHVTTRATMVREAGRLRSRAELAKDKIVGLGGGHRNEASGLVSFVYTRDRAEWLTKVMRIAALACRNEISAVDLAKAVLDWTGFPENDPWETSIELLADLDEHRDEDEEDLLPSHVDGVLMALGGDEMVAAWREGNLYLNRRSLRWIIDDFAQEIEAHFDLPQSKYRLITSLEQAIGAFVNPDHENLTECAPVAGFTGSFHDFCRINANDVAIVQAAVRHGAKDDYVATECELRFAPDDIAIVAISDA